MAQKSKSLYYGDGCYYGEPACHGRLWTCRTCKNKYCQLHWHETSKGRNVECVVCERERKEAEKEKQDARIL